jgi:hypothetical protein
MKYNTVGTAPSTANKYHVTTANLPCKVSSISRYLLLESLSLYSAIACHCAMKFWRPEFFSRFFGGGRGGGGGRNDRPPTSVWRIRFFTLHKPFWSHLAIWKSILSWFVFYDTWIDRMHSFQLKFQFLCLNLENREKAWSIQQDWTLSRFQR